MDFRTLQYFITVAEELNITHAAQKLKISQPPLSNQIRELERDLGTQLFIRGNRSLTLTPTGSMFLKRARQLISLSARAREEIASYEKELSGSLALGTVEGRAPFLLARWISGFRDEFPYVTYTLHSGGSDEILEQLYQHLIDIAVIAAPYNHELLEGFSVGQEPWVAIIPGSHPLAQLPGREIPLSALHMEPLIIPERASRVAAIEQWFAASHLEPHILCRLSNYLDAVALVEQGVGICIFPQTTYSPNPHIVTKLITDPPKSVEYMLVHIKNQPLPELAVAFMEYVKDFMEEERMYTERFQTKEEEFVIPPEATPL